MTPLYLQKTELSFFTEQKKTSFIEKKMVAYDTRNVSYFPNITNVVNYHVRLLYTVLALQRSREEWYELNVDR